MYSKFGGQLEEIFSQPNVGNWSKNGQWLAAIFIALSI